MDNTTLSIPPDAGLIPESVAVASLYKALQQLSDPRRGQGKRYELTLILCLLVASETGWGNEYERSDRLDSASSCCSGRPVQTAPKDDAVTDDVLQRASESRC